MLRVFPNLFDCQDKMSHATLTATAGQVKAEVGNPLYFLFFLFSYKHFLSSGRSLLAGSKIPPLHKVRWDPFTQKKLICISVATFGGMPLFWDLPALP